MPDFLIADLTRDQIAWLDKLIDVFPWPTEAAEFDPIVITLDYAKNWMMHKKQRMQNNPDA